jgi:type I restriction enzyme, S subunit
MRRVTVQLGDFLTLKRGYDLPEHARLPGEIPVVSSSGVTGTHKEAKVDGPGVVTGRYGTLGEVFYIDEPFWPLNTALYVQDFKGNHRRFVSYFLKWVLNGTQSDKAAVPGVNRNDLHGRKVKIPEDLGEQASIASILSAYDDLIENNRRRIQLLEQAAQLLYKEWFVHLRFPGHEHAQIIDGVPEGWKAGTIGDLGEVITGKTPSKKKSENYGHDLPFIKTPDMHGNAIVVQTEESLSEEGAKTQANKTLPPRSILVSCIGTVGAVAFNASPAQTNQQINSIVPASDSVTYWAYFTAKELKPLLDGMGGGATMANVNKSKFSGIKIVIPSKN